MNLIKDGITCPCKTNELINDFCYCKIEKTSLSKNSKKKGSNRYKIRNR